MIDALMAAVRDTLYAAPFGWDKRTLLIMDDGHPPPGCGDWFLAIHQSQQKGDMMNALNGYYGYYLTLTRRVSGTPIDRIGEAILSNTLTRTLAKEAGFNAKADQLTTFLHMNWWIIGAANDLMVKMEANNYVVNGFCEPAHWEHTEKAKLVGGEWFSANPNTSDVGLTAEIRFAGARRLQPIATYS